MRDAENNLDVSVSFNAPGMSKPVFGRTRRVLHGFHHFHGCRDVRYSSTQRVFCGCLTSYSSFA